MTLIKGDCLKLMKSIPKESIDLIYLDPPFNSNKDYKQFDDRWGSTDKYITFLYDRVTLMKTLLKPTGSFYLHCDPTESHYIKVNVLDKIFGRSNFRNEIVWSYNTRTMAANWFAKKHDTIFFYTKSSDYTFNADDIRVPLLEDSLKQYNKIDENGKKYKAQSNNGRTYLDEKGQNCGSVWNIQILGSRDKERIGYPTQKPVALMERIIKASSNPGDIVLDPFMGSGTTGVAAIKLGRKFIGIDISASALATAKKRIK